MRRRRCLRVVNCVSVRTSRRRGSCGDGTRRCKIRAPSLGAGIEIRMHCIVERQGQAGTRRVAVAGGGVGRDGMIGCIREYAVGVHSISLKASLIQISEAGLGL